MTAPRLLLERLASGALLVALMALLWGLGVAPWLDGLDTAVVDWEQARRSLVAQHRVINGSANVAQRLQKLEASPAYAAVFPGSIDVPTGEIKVQAAVRAVVEGRGGRLTTLQSLPAVEAWPGFARVSVRLGMLVDNLQLVDVLDQLQRARPYLFVDNVAVRRTAADDGARLTVSFEVHGYVPKAGL